MAYWRNYRKISTEVNELVAVESSDDEKSNENQFVIDPQQNEKFESVACTSSNSSDGFVSEDDGAVACASDSDSVCSETNLPTPDRCDVDLRHKLHLWATRNKCKHSAVNELLGILREQGHNLPKDTRTPLHTPRDATVESKFGSQYIYFGIESGLLNILSKYPQVANRLRFS